MKFKKIRPEFRYKFSELLFIIVYWVIMLRFVFIINYFGNETKNLNLIQEPKAISFLRESLILGVGASLSIGLITGLLELFVFQRYFKNRSFLHVFLLKMLVYLISILTISTWTIYFYQWFYKEMDFPTAIENTIAIFESQGFYQLFLTGMLLSLGLNFILIIKNNIGHRVFFPIIMGRYHQPKEENRIFTFIDLKSSTHMAETLGHLKYSRLIQDCFKDLSDLIIKHNGSIYQFVGDEAVISWKSKHFINNTYSIALFLDFKNKILERGDYYQETYGVKPEFKASTHKGSVMVAEVGGHIKSEIAYHGDVLNSCSRMMELCIRYSTDHIVSEEVIKDVSDHDLINQYHFEGEVELRGKDSKILAYSRIVKY